MKRAIITLLLLLFSIESCETEYLLSGNKIEINNTIEKDNKIVAFINPYKNNVDKQMDSVLAYSPVDYDKKNGVLNTAIGI